MGLLKIYNGSGWTIACRDGYSGYSGISGYSGTSGYSGKSGYSGIGTSGYSGVSGASNISGYSGTSGTSGYSGRTDGLSGYITRTFNITSLSTDGGTTYGPVDWAYGGRVNSTLKVVAWNTRTPPELNDVTKIIIQAVADEASNVGYGMQAKIYFDCGAENESSSQYYNSVVKTSKTTSFGLFEVIVWELTTADIAEIANVGPAFFFHVRLQGQAASGSNKATNATICSVTYEHTVI